MLLSILKFLWHTLAISGFIYLFSWNLFFTYQDIKKKYEKKKQFQKKDDEKDNNDYLKI